MYTVVMKHKEASIQILEYRVHLHNHMKLKQKLEELIDNGCNHISLDFRHVKYIDCTSIGMILSYHKRLECQNGQIHIVNIQSQHLLEIFSIMKLDEILRLEKSDLY
ncbi:hypothetical protein BHU72_05725 [Desulfuribacillus stibiiarsenatis]|uniref:STAS domain-containing protein n=1 Tax=Desulfuribacillus stibiiarsenatis TaxID=1390249 RepID=A0A1E5L565_9FIRM|nr:STAS domain-containing protein [Desulfuribacillus stibiiarsenatis]OEH85109.1 hypothetical protein BHU72_05725 [Desulfuribacillus stibiiarsenatis]